MSLHSYLVAVGSNLGDRRDSVLKALNLISERGVTIEAESELVETIPIGAADQTFLNGAIVCKADIQPDDFMRLLLDVESRLGRVRDKRWGNRTLDLDILLIRDREGASIEWQSPVLTVPHPRMLERDFMLRPASAVAGHWCLPNSQQSLRSLCVSRGWRPTWSNVHGEIKVMQALKGDIFAASTSRLWWPVLILGLLWRLWLAATIPFGNDEAYYWDWGRVLKLSYFDHPPFVAWISSFSQTLIGHWFFGPLQGRLLVPFLHLGACLMFSALVVRLSKRVLTNMESRAVLLITQAVPVFSLGGMMLMPDIGLILFSTSAAWLAVALSRRIHLSWWYGIFLGTLLGAAGLSKYHAALIASGMIVVLFLERQEQFDDEKPFWICLILSGLIMISPVLIWNGFHDWVSFKFQASRGFSGNGFDWKAAGRTLLGEIILTGPLLVVGLLKGVFTLNHPLSTERKLLFWSAVPLLVLLKIFSFTSQALPHWSLPSLWLLSPFAVQVIAKSALIRWSGRTYGLLLCLIAPALLSFPDTRRAVLRWTGDRPGGLGELTLWANGAKDQDLLTYVQEDQWQQIKQPSQPCTESTSYAAPRWFTVAQVAANFPGHPMVQSIDPEKISAYSFRTRKRQSGCPVIIFSEKSHWNNLERFNSVVQIQDSREFEIEGHRDRLVVITRAFWR